MVEVSIGGLGQLQCPEADIVKSLVVNAEGLIGVLHQLVNRERSIVRIVALYASRLGQKKIIPTIF